MKRLKLAAILSFSKVAPRAGAWIETSAPIVVPAIPVSPPARGRGLKRKRLAWIGVSTLVAPRAGAWIETSTQLCPKQ